MKKAYAIAQTDDFGCGELELNVYYSEVDLIDHLEDCIHRDIGPPRESDTWADYYRRYYDWVKEENNNECEYSFEIEEITIM